MYTINNLAYDNDSNSGVNDVDKNKIKMPYNLLYYSRYPYTSFGSLLQVAGICTASLPQYDVLIITSR